MATRIGGLRPRGAVGWGSAAFALACLCLLLRSYLLVVRYRVGEAWFDLWYWVADAERWFDGTFTVHDLIKPHFEHRIATTRLFLLADTLFDDMRGRIPLVANFAFLAVMAGLVWRLTRGAPARLPLLFWAAWFTALCQGQNLTTPFQLQFGIVICLAAAAASVLTGGVPAQDSTNGAIRRGIAGGGLTVLAQFSMGSGVVLAPALLPALVLRRARSAAWGSFLLMSGLGLLAFFHGYVRPHNDLRLTDPALLWPRLRFFGDCLASMFNAFPGAAHPLGLAGFAIWCAFALRALRAWRARAAVTGAEAALLALGLFVILSAAAAASTNRVGFGPHPALVSRYASMSLTFVASLLGLACWQGRRAGTRRALLLGATAGVLLVAADLPLYADMARLAQQPIRASADLQANNVAEEGPAPVLFLAPLAKVRPQIAFLHREKLNLFAPADRPPQKAMTAILAGGALPACLGSIDAVQKLDGRAAAVRGWAVAPDGRAPARWVVAAANGAILGAARQLQPRADLVAALNLPAAAGFETGFAAPAGPLGATMAMFGVLDDARVCRLPDARITPPGSMPLSALHDPPALLAAAAAVAPTRQPPLPTGLGALRAWRGGDATALDLDIPAAALPTPNHGQAIGLPYKPAHDGRPAVVTIARAGVALRQPLLAWWGHDDWRLLLIRPEDLPGAADADLAIHVDFGAPVTEPAWVAEPVRIAAPADWTRLY